LESSVLCMLAAGGFLSGALERETLRACEL